jgi:hypothetical protein
MDPTMKVKAGAGVLVLGCVMALAMTHQITGADALGAVKWVGSAFLLGAAALGGMTSIAEALKARIAADGKDGAK